MEKQLQDTARRRKRFTLFMLAAVAPLLMGSLCCGSLSPSNFSGSTHTTTGTLATTGFNQLHMFDANDGWASSNSAIMKTVDGGHTWIDVTPTDWEPLPTTATPDTTNQDKGITATSFFDMNHAWMVSDTVSADDTAATINAAVTINASSTNTTNVQIPQTSTSIIVRSTVDGGATWMSSNTITVTNLVAVYPPSFINDVEGWMELTFTTKTQVSSNSNNSDANDLVVIFHSVDGGITWTPIVPKTFSQFTHNILNEDGIKTGLTMTPYCTTPASALPACSSYKSNNVATTTINQGCSVTGSTNTLGWATAATPQKIYTEQTTNSARSWSAIGGNAPGGIPKQNNNSQVVVSPPTMFPDGNGILPVQVQSDPDGNDPSYFYLHLYDIIYNLGHQFVIPASYGPTTTFAVDPIYSQQVLSAPDIKHVFVIGQAPKANKDSNGDTIYGDWNLYEFNGGSWQMISSQADATIPTPAAGQQAAMLKGGTLSNLDFISDTEGFATDGTNFYHITLNNNVATWSQVYPPNVSTININGTPSPSAPVDVIREPGTVVPTAHPGPCIVPKPTPTPFTNPPPAGYRTFTFVNNLSETIWVQATTSVGYPVPATTNWEVPAGSSVTTTVIPNGWNGRLFGETGCDANGQQCQTGECQTCAMSPTTGFHPVSLAEFNLKNTDYYDISLVDGFNLPMWINSYGTSPDGINAEGCSLPNSGVGVGCTSNANAVCPTVLQVTDASGNVIACESSCTKFGTQQYCCPNGSAYGSAQTCLPSTWAVNSAAIFKAAEAFAYSYAFDDQNSTLTCTGNCNYRITFGTTG